MAYVFRVALDDAFGVEDVKTFIASWFFVDDGLSVVNFKTSW